LLFLALSRPFLVSVSFLSPTLISMSFPSIYVKDMAPNTQNVLTNPWGEPSIQAANCDHGNLVWSAIGTEKHSKRAIWGSSVVYALLILVLMRHKMDYVWFTLRPPSLAMLYSLGTRCTEAGVSHGSCVRSMLQALV
jgi:hypothetical protein